ncbi:MAG: LamG domain-containing protein [archaeon GB-1867-005]|nr:LamG domain-containing protein [Candidatus Culexmicrobium cathedralense]
MHPVLVLPLNEGSGDIVYDRSGRNNHGTIYGASWVRKYRDYLLYFDGEDDYIHVPDTPDINLDVHTERTIVVWFYVIDKDISNRKQVIYEEGATVRGLNIYVHAGYLYIGGWNTPSGESGWSGTFLYTDEIESRKWHWAALTLKGGTSLSPDAFKGYLDGVLFGSGEGSQLWAHSGDIGIGAMKDSTKFHDGAASGDGHWFNGYIGEVLIFNKELTAEQLSFLHNLFRGEMRKPPTF